MNEYQEESYRICHGCMVIKGKRYCLVNAKEIAESFKWFHKRGQVEMRERCASEEKGRVLRKKISRGSR